ncbi:MAG: NUDIX hydrolase [Lewinella sp.]|nr:NUDIX hydrolase [Lewinella sp.]
MSYTYEYPRPALTVDCVIFGLDESSKLKILLIQRALEPFKGAWALPGGFVDMEEDLEEAALRELREETGVKDVFIEQLFTFGKPGRDPRGRVVSVAYYALVNLSEHPVQAASDADHVEWFELDELPRLAFDHDQIVQVAVNRLRSKVRYQPIGFELLPENFTLSQLQKLYETVLGVKQLNKRNFRTRILKMGVLNEVGKQEGVAHRPAVLYRFDKAKYEQLVQERYENLIRRGVDFEV